MSRSRRVTKTIIITCHLNNNDHNDHVNNNEIQGGIRRNSTKENV